jgi:hypothetical protein
LSQIYQFLEFCCIHLTMGQEVQQCTYIISSRFLKSSSLLNLRPYPCPTLIHTCLKSRRGVRTFKYEEGNNIPPIMKKVTIFHHCRQFAKSGGTGRTALSPWSHSNCCFGIFCILYVLVAPCFVTQNMFLHSMQCKSELFL